MRHEGESLTRGQADATPKAVRHILACVRDALTCRKCSVADVDTVELVMAEALNNIVEHAYAGRLDGSISYDVQARPDAVVIEITDSGVVLPDGSLPTGKPADLNAPREDVAEGGYGWLMIRTLATDVRYTRLRRTNRLSLRVALSDVHAA